MKVSFSGIHDIRFPYGTSDSEIMEKYALIKDYTDKKFRVGDVSLFDVSIKDSFNYQKSDKKLADKGIRLMSTVENPWNTAAVLNQIDENLVQQYIDQTKTELILNA